MRVLYTATALLLSCVLAIGAIGAASQASTSAAVGAAAACTWLDPQPERIAITMKLLTDEPVDARHWEKWVAEAHGLTTSDYYASTTDDRHLLLLTAITATLNADLQSDITTPVITWWAAAMPADDTDNRWKTVTVPGWDGNLETYIATYANAYATDPNVLTAVEAAGLPSACAQPAPEAICPQPYDPASALVATRLIESGGNYTDNHDLPVSADDDPPTGAYHHTRQNWAGYGGYLDAWQAPAGVQDARALADITTIINTVGDDPKWIPVAWTAGLDIAQQIHDGQLSTSYIPTVGGISVAAYQARWLQIYVEALTRNGITPNDCQTGAAAVIAWADTQIGAPTCQSAPGDSASPGPAAPNASPAAHHPPPAAGPTPKAPSPTTAPASSSPPGNTAASTSAPSASTAHKTSTPTCSPTPTRTPSNQATSPSTAPSTASATSSSSTTSTKTVRSTRSRTTAAEGSMSASSTGVASQPSNIQ
jgi:hypothetical protein